MVKYFTAWLFMLFANMPVAFSLAVMAVAWLLLSDPKLMVNVPQRLVGGIDSTSKRQPLVGVQREGEHAHHHPFVRLRGMAGEREGVVRVVMAVHVGHIEIDAMNRGVLGHG